MTTGNPMQLGMVVGSDAAAPASSVASCVTVIPVWSTT